MNEERRWIRLQVFLRDERAEQEIFVISEKMEQSLSLNFQTKFDKEKEKREKVIRIQNPKIPAEDIPH